MIKLVIVESPYAGDVEWNSEYARKACLHCISNNETPFASHLFYPQFLDEDNEGDRHCGISRGLEWGQAAFHASISTENLFSLTVAFYVDIGWSKGMEAALEYYTDLGARCMIRRLPAISASNGSSQIDTPDEDRA